MSPREAYLGLLSAGITSTYVIPFTYVWELNSYSHTCVASVSLPELSPQPRNTVGLDGNSRIVTWQRFVEQGANAFHVVYKL